MSKRINKKTSTNKHRKEATQCENNKLTIKLCDIEEIDNTKDIPVENGGLIDNQISIKLIVCNQKLEKVEMRTVINIPQLLLGICFLLVISYLLINGSLSFFNYCLAMGFFLTLVNDIKFNNLTLEKYFNLARQFFTKFRKTDKPSKNNRR